MDTGGGHRRHGLNGKIPSEDISIWMAFRLTGWIREHRESFLFSQNSL